MLAHEVAPHFLWDDQLTDVMEGELEEFKHSLIGIIVSGCWTFIINALMYKIENNIISQSNEMILISNYEPW